MHTMWLDVFEKPKQWEGHVPFWYGTALPWPQRPEVFCPSWYQLGVSRNRYLHTVLATVQYRQPYRSYLPCTDGTVATKGDSR